MDIERMNRLFSARQAEGRMAAFKERMIQELELDRSVLDSGKPPFEIAQFLNNLNPTSYLADTRWGPGGPAYDSPLDKEEIGPEANLTWTIPCLPHEHFRQRWEEIVNQGATHDALPFPGFYAAAPRKNLNFDLFNPKRLKVGILTAGGLAPGLNTVVHRILRRHEIYTMNVLKIHENNEDKKGVAALLHAIGYRDGFNGLISGKDDMYLPLMSSSKTLPNRLTAIHSDAKHHKDFLETDFYKNLGGSFLGAGRGNSSSTEGLALAAEVVRDHHLDILYCIGGNGTVTGAYLLSKELDRLGIDTKVCVVPKTIDNDLLWAENSFGFQSSVDKGVGALEEMHTEATGTNRLAIVQFMGRDSGFIAASASLASGITTLCLVPEVHKVIDVNEIYKRYKHVLDTGKGHGLIVIAEGCRAGAWRGLPEAFAKQYSRKAETQKEAEDRKPAGQLLYEALKARSKHVVFHDAGYVVRSVPPNPSDRILCRRLANLAVDNVLAGYDRFVVSPVLGGYALVPLRIAADTKHGGVGGPKTINPKGSFWAEVASRNAQFDFDRLQPD